MMSEQRAVLSSRTSGFSGLEPSGQSGQHTVISTIVGISNHLLPFLSLLNNAKLHPSLV
jgi:hypothetical protein